MWMLCLIGLTQVTKLFNSIQQCSIDMWNVEAQQEPRNTVDSRFYAIEGDNRIFV